MLSFLDPAVLILYFQGLLFLYLFVFFLISNVASCSRRRLLKYNDGVAPKKGSGMLSLRKAKTNCFRRWFYFFPNIKKHENQLIVHLLVRPHR